MGKAARSKRERRAPAPPPVRGKGGAAGADPRRAAVIATGVLVLVVAVVVGVLLVTRSGSSATGKRGTPSAEDRNAPAALVKAADDVGFAPTTEPGVGQVEDKPAADAPPAAATTLLAPGTKAPAFALKTPQGTSVSLASYRGKAVLLEFFATWCPHCNAEAPHLRTLSQDLPASKVAFLSVNGDGETAPSVFAYHRYWGFDFPALLDPSSQPGSFHSPGASGRVSNAYRIQNFPTFYVIDARGRVAWASDGEQPDAKLRQELLEAAHA